MKLLQTIIESPVGRLFAFASEVGVRAVLWSESDVRRVAMFEAAAMVENSHPQFRNLLDQLEAYFVGDRRTFDLALDPIGTEFQLEAWRALSAIPFGETRTYSDQAEAIGRPTAVRAVGAANAKNPLSIIVPCHRVIGADGSLTGFAGGLDTKRYLLDHESSGLAQQ